MLKNPTLKNVSDPNFGKPPDKQNPLLQQLGAPHVTSFNYMLNVGLKQALKDIDPIEFKLPVNDTKIKLHFEDIHINNPKLPLGVIGTKSHLIYPSECRQRAATYKGQLRVTLAWSIDDCIQVPIVKDLGDIPIMLKSNKCHLNKMTPAELVSHGEHEQEWGGYFIIKGHERLIRMLLMTRRNYPIAVKRPSWKSRGNLFSEFGIMIRCVMEDQTSTNNILHFVTNGSVKLMFSHRKILYFVPLLLILKCLCNYNDHYIYKKLMEGFEDNLYYSDSLKKMLRGIHSENLHTHHDCKSYLGRTFRGRFFECPEWYTDSQVTDYILKRCVLIHLNNNEDKFNLLCFMTQKLFVFSQDKCKTEGVDAVMMQEMLLGGHLYLKVIKERLYTWLTMLKAILLKMSKEKTKFSCDHAHMLRACKQTGNMENYMEYFLATGNLQSSHSGLGLMQDKGLTIVAENINRMRYMSHFKAIHRGAFFQQMRTTEARQLLPDAWGFVCPVHTPDGAPCGLLNHLTLNCTVTDIPNDQLVRNIPKVLIELGMIPIESNLKLDFNKYYNTQLDGRIIGYLSKDIAGRVVDKLRMLKINGDKVPNTLEIALVPIKENVSQYAGLFMFTGPARMMRPLLNIAANKIELIGTFEQVYLDICVTLNEAYTGVTTHSELEKTDFLSNLAQLIPMPDCNQSPRNMYQCQMGKQTMGTPCHNWDLQAETKMYRLQTPTTPLFRPVHHDNIQLDDFAMGTNAIVAVISYTGYDMEDAMIINKASEERGLAHGSIFKSEFIELKENSDYFCRDPNSSNMTNYLDTDGLPYHGRAMNDNEPLYSYYSPDRSKFVAVAFHGKETCYIHSVKLCSQLGKRTRRLACITFRVPRNPSVGDKFASRAGQKGICSQKWPAEDLPFTETGLVPDIVFNPHGFPSRMTIAMMIEIMAGKSAALHGLVHDATPFRFTESDTAIDYFGKLLEEAGYNYYGTETMYSGVDGREMNARIFFGIVHYQRLRHMVSDKWQVRSTGPIDALTRQPLKGRKKGGGVRFGEMERDALISHGASFLLQDRLLHCSDKMTCFICTTCKTMLGPITVTTKIGYRAQLIETNETCRFCGNGDGIAEIQVPYIFKFFVTQLASCNINIKIDCKHI